MPSNVWIDEETAAKKFGYKPYTLRRYVKGGKLDISYVTIRKKTLYCEKSINKLLEKNATIIL